MSVILVQFYKGTGRSSIPRSCGVVKIHDAYGYKLSIAHEGPRYTQEELWKCKGACKTFESSNTPINNQWI